ncbi:hypothetical protein S7711_05765 [Stachybotrys chartarum IBT 7711]|uniref:Protein kinase domain-containing protein n=1 Tax=Stachybotrys chartarum (strain CBS 109288 / IBT 7711) TaxID=1280523 RepID=A0A084ATF0_STACB|nr:hypothetical protein S7711_05765 [Stachybotrys chartarum IBT 7711]
MYVHYPEPGADLVPLPEFEGPKLEPFTFQGKRKIEFLEGLGSGTHSWVFKVRIDGQIYALKLFCFTDEVYLPSYPLSHWKKDYSKVEVTPEEAQTMQAFYNAFDPFMCECRAFGRLKEAGLDGQLALKCFGYVLLDEDEERALMEQFHYQVSFLGWTGGGSCTFEFDPSRVVDREPLMVRTEYSSGPITTLRERFRKNGRLPPITGIVKEYGRLDPDLGVVGHRRILQAIQGLHRVGIFSLDVTQRQIISGRLADFSMAFTTPHVLSEPGLDPNLDPRILPFLEEQVFETCYSDYLMFNLMLTDPENIPPTKPRKQLVQHRLSAFPASNSGSFSWSYGGSLRSMDRDGDGPDGFSRIWTYADPRKFDWRMITAVDGTTPTAKTAAAVARESRAGRKGRSKKKIAGAGRRQDTQTKLSRPRTPATESDVPPLDTKVAKWLRQRVDPWHFNCSPEKADKIKNDAWPGFKLRWRLKDGVLHAECFGPEKE